MGESPCLPAAFLLVFLFCFVFFVPLDEGGEGVWGGVAENSKNGFRQLLSLGRG